MTRLRVATFVLAVPMYFVALAQEPALQVELTAVPRYTATYSWEIGKSVLNEVPVVLSVGQVPTLDYRVSLTRSAPMLSGWAAEGQFSINNTTGTDALIISWVVWPVVEWTLECPLFDNPLPPGSSVTCSWAAELPDGATRTLYGTVQWLDARADPNVPPGLVVVDATSTATVDFTGVAPTSEIDECATGKDAAIGSFGQQCETGSHEYTLMPPPYEACGSYEFTNHAEFVTNDTGATGETTYVVPISVPCVTGCTLSQGYWKTHSDRGPAPYDDAWGIVGVDTPFFSSGASWLEQFSIEPAGNAYWLLAHAYAAARINVLNGASFDAIASTAAHAAEMLELYTPGEIAPLKGGSAIRADFVRTATALDAYNNGLVGPGACDE